MVPIQICVQADLGSRRQSFKFSRLPIGSMEVCLVFHFFLIGEEI